MVTNSFFLFHKNSEEYLYQKKQERFKKTAFGVQTIVSRKLYRAANLTVEEYFRKKWNISRARMYPLLFIHNKNKLKWNSILI